MDLPKLIDERPAIHREILKFFTENEDFVRDVKENLSEEDQLFFSHVCIDPPKKGSMIGRKLGWERYKISRATERLSGTLNRVSQKHNLRHPINVSSKYKGRQTGLAFHCGHLTIEEVKENLTIPQVQIEQCLAAVRDIRKESLSCLKPIRKVLEWGISQDPEWFRRRGPVWVDFVNELICPRKKKLKALKDLVIAHSVSLLEGDKATGKTVLLLNLAYDLHKNDQIDVFYFNVPEDGKFEHTDLVNEIKRTDGIVMIDNIHRAWGKIQEVHSEFKNDGTKHILFGARPPYRECKYSFSEDLTKINKMILKPSLEEADVLINYFRERHDPSVFTSENCLKIKNAFWQDLWLLSYALRGCKNAQGKGNPIEWVRDGVIKDLKYLEGKRTVYPEILVVLSPLYKNEVLTEQSFLINKLGFKAQDLFDLYQMGEINKRDTKDGFVFYGLPHSALADAYWEYGSRYQNLVVNGNCHHFIRSYALSNVPNGLEAITKANDKVRVSLMTDLLISGQVATVMKMEQSIDAFGLLAEKDAALFNACFRHSSMLQILAHKMEDHLDFEDHFESYSAMFQLLRRPNCFFKLAHPTPEEQLWPLLNHQKMADHLIENPASVVIYESILGPRRLTQVLQLARNKKNMG